MTLPRLSDATAPALPYARGGLRAGIVHLGTGAFHRAHQAVYVDDLLAESPDWAILGASLRQGDTRDALAPQDWLYTLAVAGPQGVTRRVIGSVTGVLVGPEDPGALIAAMSAPAIRIVSMTVTEKGYCHDPATGALDETHPDVAHDLRHPDAPRSAIGYLTAALARRRAAGIAPFTVLCCDNLPSNGRTVRRIVARFAGLMDPALGAFVDSEVAFPCTMVDRIVPATTEADRAANDAALGLHDAWPVVTEPFTQWVIEDDFPAGRPDFARAGAQMVVDVAPFERMKLRMLNGAHSTLAYLGYLAGHETVADAMADPPFAALARGLMSEEIMPVLEVPHGADLAGYRDALLGRFANPGLRHRTWQIAMDGSQKLPQRLLGTARERLAAGAPIPRIALAVAGWIRYAAGTDEKGGAIDVRDPLAARFREVATEAQGDAARLAAGFLGLDAVFGEDLPRNPAFREPVTKALTALIARGARATVAAL